MRLDTVGLLARMAFRNLFASKLKTLIVGSIVLGGAFLVVSLNSLLDSVADGMSQSIIGSCAGNIQVYSGKSKDKLELWGSFGGFSDLAPIEDFAPLKRTLLTVPNVRDVVPMGINGALQNSGNTIDQSLEKLRDLVRKSRAGDRTAGTRAELAAQRALVRQMVTLLRADLNNLKGLASDTKAAAETIRRVDHATTDAFWSGFSADPYPALEYLENKVAPEATDSDLLFFGYIGTDLDEFHKSFGRMEIVDGTMVPTGKRGFLFAKMAYEENLKLKVARRLDRIHEALAQGGRTLAKDPELQRFVKENAAQVHEILYRLNPRQAAQATTDLRRDLADAKSPLDALLVNLVTLDDRDAERKYRLFYTDVAPHLELYRAKVGDVLTLKAFTRSGYTESVNVKLYGTFQFRGLEKSALAGGMSLMDLATFRDLYGFMTPEKRAEIKRLQLATGVKAVSRENAEAELFGTGGGTNAGAAAPAVVVVPKKLGDYALARKEGGGADRPVTRAEMESGVVLNAAVILKDPSRMRRTMQDIEAAAKRDGLDLKVVSWQTAAGMLGQLVLLLRMVLYVAFTIIFLVAIIILNNAMVMAALERVKDIGTLRAVGAQRGFIFAMILVEAAIIGAVFGGLGILLGCAGVTLLDHIGIPATSDVMFFFFSGPRLRMAVTAGSIVLACAVVVVVNTLSAAYPAWLAMRVTPRQAMAEDA